MQLARVLGKSHEIAHVQMGILGYCMAYGD